MLTRRDKCFLLARHPMISDWWIDVVSNNDHEMRQLLLKLFSSL